MMSRHVTEPRRWGEKREHARKTRSWLILGATCVLSGAAAVVLPFVSQGHGVFDHRHWNGDASLPVRAVVGILFTATLMIAARQNWLASDEMKRRSITNFWAAIGFGTLAMFPILHILAPVIDPETRIALIYGAALAAGTLSYLYRKVRGTAP